MNRFDPILPRDVCFPGEATNDNTPATAADPILNAALRHFGLHGLAAAAEAERLAMAALQAGDTAECARWGAICAIFDRRTASRIDAALTSRHCAQG